MIQSVENCSGKLRAKLIKVAKKERSQRQQITYFIIIETVMVS